MKKFSSEKQKIGEIGENIVCQYMQNAGFTIIERNYTKKWGEIDIIAKKADVIHFIEVKTVTRESFNSNMNDSFRPEDQMHKGKQSNMIKTIETYLIGHKIGDWVIDLACVYIDNKKRLAKVKIMPNIIF